MSRPWTDAEILWLINNAANLTPLQAVQSLNQTFQGEPRTTDSIRKKIKRLSLQTHMASKVSDSVIEVDEWKALASKKYPYPTMEKPSRSKSRRKKDYKTYLIWSDTHVPHEDHRAVQAVLQLMDNVVFDGIVVLGDFLDMECLSHWNKDKRLRVEGLRLKDQYAAGNALLDEICKRLPRGADMRWLDGNHEDWYYQYIERHPELEGLLDPHDELRLEKRGFKEIRRYAGEEWKTLNEGEYRTLMQQQFIRLGKLWVMHGLYTVKHHASQHIEKIKRNVMYGHVHDIQVFSSHSIARENSFMAYSIGCLADVSPDYMKGTPNNWSHGVGIVHVYDDGDFQAEVLRIIDGKLIYNGVRYGGE